jgi:hypothetical protein
VVGDEAAEQLVADDQNGRDRQPRQAKFGVEPDTGPAGGEQGHRHDGQQIAAAMLDDTQPPGIQNAPHSLEEFAKSRLHKALGVDMAKVNR